MCMHKMSRMHKMSDVFTDSRHGKHPPCISLSTRHIYSYDIGYDMSMSMYHVMYSDVNA